MDRASSSMTAVEDSHESLVPPAWSHSVRAVGRSESAAAGRSLAHSFAADPLSRYLMNSGDMDILSAEEKWKIHVALMTTVAASHIHRGLITAVGPDYDALAVWSVPGTSTDGWWTFVRSGMLNLYFKLSREGRRRYYKEMLPLLHRTKMETLKERDNDSYYLVYIGTKPHARGRGYATMLIRDMIARADSENRPMYLESSSGSNTAFYERFGFKVRGKIALGRGRDPIEMDIMVREPRPLKDADMSSPASSKASSRVGA